MSDGAVGLIERAANQLLLDVAEVLAQIEPPLRDRRDDAGLARCGAARRSASGGRSRSTSGSDTGSPGARRGSAARARCRASDSRAEQSSAVGVKRDRRRGRRASPRAHEMRRSARAGRRCARAAAARDREHVEPEEQILAELARRRSRPRDRDAWPRRCARSHGAGSPLPTRSNARSWSTRSSFTCMSRLMSPISSRNSVPPSASSKRPMRVVDRARERALLVTEQLALEQVARNRAAVDRDERPVARARTARGCGARRALCRNRTRRGSAPCCRSRATCRISWSSPLMAAERPTGNAPSTHCFIAIIHCTFAASLPLRRTVSVSGFAAAAVRRSVVLMVGQCSTRLCYAARREKYVQ